jgi:hypothetical protein
MNKKKWMLKATTSLWYIYFLIFINAFNSFGD